MAVNVGSTMNGRTSAGEGVNYASCSTFLLHHPHRRCRLPVPPVSTTVDTERQFLQLFEHVDHVADPGGPSSRRIKEVDRLQRHQAPAPSCDEDNSTGSNDFITASGPLVSDVTAPSRDTADEKLSTFQRPKHRQVPTVLVDDEALNNQFSLRRNSIQTRKHYTP